MPGHIVVSTTTDSRDVANAIADALLANRLAACVQMLPVQSAYTWEGRIERADEVLLLIKARAEDFPAVAAEITARHTYTVPQITATAIVVGSAAYLDWVDSATTR